MIQHKITLTFKGKSVSRYVSDKFYQANKNRSYIMELLIGKWRKKYGTTKDYSNKDEVTNQEVIDKDYEPQKNEEELGNNGEPIDTREPEADDSGEGGIAGYKSSRYY